MLAQPANGQPAAACKQCLAQPANGRVHLRVAGCFAKRCTPQNLQPGMSAIGARDVAVAWCCRRISHAMPAAYAFFCPGGALLRHHCARLHSNGAVSPGCAARAHTRPIANVGALLAPHTHAHAHTNTHTHTHTHTHNKHTHTHTHTHTNPQKRLRTAVFLGEVIPWWLAPVGYGGLAVLSTIFIPMVGPLFRASFASVAPSLPCRRLLRLLSTILSQ